MLVLAGEVVSVAPVLLLTDGTGGEHSARLSLPDSVTGSFSALELDSYAVYVGTLAVVLLPARRRRAATPLTATGRSPWPSASRGRPRTTVRHAVPGEFDRPPRAGAPRLALLAPSTVLLTRCSFGQGPGQEPVAY